MMIIERALAKENLISKVGKLHRRALLEALEKMKLLLADDGHEVEVEFWQNTAEMHTEIMRCLKVTQLQCKEFKTKLAGKKGRHDQHKG